MPRIMPIRDLRKTSEISELAHKFQLKKPERSQTRNIMAKKYEVLLYPKAYRDIEEIYAYIALEKLSPENAKGQTDRIWDAIFTLDEYPESHQDRQVGRYAGKGYKQLLIDDYIAIFKIDESEKKVYVITIQYQGRNM